jgi:hypothetical protein
MQLAKHYRKPANLTTEKTTQILNRAKETEGLWGILDKPFEGFTDLDWERMTSLIVSSYKYVHSHKPYRKAHPQV